MSLRTSSYIELQHRNWEQASAKLGNLRTQGELEDAKSQAQRVIHSDAPLEERVKAQIAVIRAHFERSVAAGMCYQWEKHPDFATYAAAYEVGVYDHLADVWAEVRRQYPHEPSPHLEPGYSYWKPPV
jgi:hypothetical protein